MSNSIYTELMPVNNSFLLDDPQINPSLYLIAQNSLNEFSDSPEIKVGYEIEVYTDLTPSTISTFEDISDNELTNESEIIEKPILSPKSILNWNSNQIMRWILDLYDEAKYRYEDLNLYPLNRRDGSFLMNLTENDWKKIDKKRSKWLYKKVQELIRQSNKELPPFIDESLPTTENPPRRKRGRPRSETAKRRPEQKIGRVWEFLRNLLLDPNYCPSLIYWEDYKTKKFRLVDGSKVAKLWGVKKNNPKMTYEKFSRTIRHYYKDKVIISVPKEKLVYRFGENAKGIETNNPNFGIAINLR